MSRGKRKKGAVDEAVEYVCGYCGESSRIAVDPFGGRDQSYVEDCPVCCRPNQVHVNVDPETLEVSVTVTYEG